MTSAYTQLGTSPRRSTIAQDFASLYEHIDTSYDPRTMAQPSSFAADNVSPGSGSTAAPPPPPQPHKRFILWEILFPRTVWSILYLLVTVIFTAAVLVLEALIFAWFTDGFGDNECNNLPKNFHDCASFWALKSTIPTYMALFIFAGAYQICVAFLALYRKNTFQLILLIIFAFAMLIYAGIQYDQIGDSYKIIVSQHFLTKEQVRALIIAIPCIIGAEALILMFLSWRLYLENNKKIFHEIGASSSRKRARRDLRIFETIILFDFFFFVGFTLQFVLIILETKGVEFGLTIAVIPVTAIVLLVAVIAVYKEVKAIVYLFLVFCLAGLAYFLYKLVRIYTTKGDKHLQYVRASKTLTVFAAITLAFLIITMFMTFKCLRNFGYHHGKSLAVDDDIDLGGPAALPDVAYYAPSNASSSMQPYDSRGVAPGTGTYHGQTGLNHDAYSEYDEHAVGAVPLTNGPGSDDDQATNYDDGLSNDKVAVAYKEKDKDPVHYAARLSEDDTPTRSSGSPHEPSLR